MKAGGHATLWIPGDLAFQDFAPPGMEPYATLIMDVTLLDIVKAPEAPAPAPAPAK